MAKNKQENLFGEVYDLEEWEKEWENMPEYKQNDLSPFQSVIVHFENKKDRDRFAKKMKQNITRFTKYLWYPKIKIERYSDKRYEDEES